MRSILKYITSRVFFTGIIILIQIVLMVTFYMGLWHCSGYVQLLLSIISLIFVLVVLNNHTDPTFKLSWIILILVLPLGWVIYLTFHGGDGSKKMVLPYSHRPDLTKPYAKDNSTLLNNLPIAKVSKYIQNVSSMTVFQSTDTKFYPCGEYFYVDYLESLKSAKEYIFLEYFIVAQGEMWNSVLNILKSKVQQGVEVRIMYDDMGTIGLLPTHYDNYLNSIGIKVVVFNKVRAFPNPSVNYRNHRKITIIDGKEAYTGGLNLSDEYINKVERFGYWKDSAIKIQGDAVHSMIKMYLQLWNYCTYSDYNSNLGKYFSNVTPSPNANGYVQPFYDNPFSKKSLSENAYLWTINNAKEYVYICTPYLILDSQTIHALKFASISGVDVRIIVPHIPDKKNVNEVTRSHYLELLQAGVKIFEFKDGFIHSKTIVSDDSLAVVGTANFDFRSFYMHFENGILMYKTSAVMQVKQDCLNLCEQQALKISLEDCQNLPLYKKLIRSILRLFSPLM